MDASAPGTNYLNAIPNKELCVVNNWSGDYATAKTRAEEAGVKDLVMSDDLKVEGSRLKLLSFLSLLDKPDTRFPIVTP